MQEFKNWAEFAKSYDLVLFNNAPSLGDGEVLQEWSEAHECEPEGDRDEFDQLRADDPDFAEQYSDTDDDFAEWSREQHQCECEVFQWYAINCGELDAEHLNKTYGMDIFFSDFLGIYILPVYHYGTSWDYVPLTAKE